MDRTKEIFQKSKNAIEYTKGYLLYISEILSKVSCEEIAQFITLIQRASKSGNTIYFIGNGGSAATASHFANDIAIGTRTKGNPFKIISLTDNNAVITAIANDYGYDNIFLKQLEALYNDGDFLVTISASGNSENLIKAVKYVQEEREGESISITGFDGGILKKISTYNLHVPSNKNEYGPVEDLHLIFDHIVGSYLMHSCAD